MIITGRDRPVLCKGSPPLWTTLGYMRQVSRNQGYRSSSNCSAAALSQNMYFHDGWYFWQESRHLHVHTALL